MKVIDYLGEVIHYSPESKMFYVDLEDQRHHAETQKDLEKLIKNKKKKLFKPFRVIWLGGHYDAPVMAKVTSFVKSAGYGSYSSRYEAWITWPNPEGHIGKKRVSCTELYPATEENTNKLYRLQKLLERQKKIGDRISSLKGKFKDKYAKASFEEKVGIKDE